jgi:acetoin utilization deacetylase AcuC-like enzyme
LTGFLYSEDFLKHDTGSLHPERKERLQTIIEKIRNSDVFDSLKWIKPEKCDVGIIAKNHSLDYIESVKRKCEMGGGTLDFGDTIVCKDSFDIASLAVGGINIMIKKIMEGEFKRGFCAVRPPGHHAEYNEAKGFCLFNNIAIAAKILLDDHHLKRIAIVDWDVHHGNGTQNSFYEDPGVFFISLHQFPHYPGTGAAPETGQGKGAGFNLNFAMNAFSGSSEYKEVFGIIKNKLNDFKPEFILISAGFDGHVDDPLSSIMLKTEDYGYFTQVLCDISEKYSEGRILSLLEGGYNLKALSESVKIHIENLI